MKTFLITGGAGFVGSHLCKRFISEGNRVLCVDSLLTGNKANVESLFSNSLFSFLEQDVTRPFEVGEKVDYVLNFASPASPMDYLRYPIKTLKVGALGTHNVLGLAKAKGARFLQASTSEIYGDPLVHPQTEDYWGNVNPIGPRGVYDEAKRFAESITLAYHRAHRVDVKIVRIFNTYGPAMRLNDGRAIPNFMYQALEGKPITIYGNGMQTRSFCYVDDLVEGITRLLFSSCNEPVNIGNPNEITLLDIAKTILELTGSKSTIEFHELPQDDPKVRKPDISRAKRVLGWEPRVDLEEGLIKTLNYFKKQIHFQTTVI
jgi:dTDP-glucose 4,6-dehydratase